MGFRHLLLGMNAKKAPLQQNSQLSTLHGFLRVFSCFVGNFAAVVLSWMLWKGNGDHISTKYQLGYAGTAGRDPFSLEINCEIMMKIGFPFLL